MMIWMYTSMHVKMCCILVKIGRCYYIQTPTDARTTYDYARKKNENPPVPGQFYLRPKHK